MDDARNQPRRRQPTIDRKTAAFHVSAASLDAVNRLVALEVFPNKSAAMDEALKILIAMHRDKLVTSEQAATI
jgi:hypothetical protein